ncbi:MAG: DUF4417 domain-containing protein [Bacteroidales bacterium]|nr:DUF4417 domain-containing protein [Bacteroidales bacterium]
MELAKDILFPSDNLYDIPCLRLDRQAGHLELPFVPYGTGRRNKRVATLHFYVDDYRFNALWKNPAKIFDNNPAAAVECNYSLFDTTPLAFGLQFIYQKRWMARYWQENGIRIYVDLNVSSKFFEYNRMGVPDGWNAFATRGALGGLELLKAKFNQARQISGFDSPNLIVYGGGKEVHEFCCRHSLLYVHDYMTEKL